MPWIVGFRHYFGDLESFQNSSNIHFGDFFISKNHTNGWFMCNTLLIWLKEFYQFKKFLLLNWKLSISLSKIYLQSCPNLLIDTNLRFLPPRNESIRSVLLELHHGWYGLHHNPPKNEVLVKENKRCRAKSTFIPI